MNENIPLWAMVWIGQDQTKLFFLSEEKMERQCFEKMEFKSTQDFYQKIGETLKHVKRIVLLSPNQLCLDPFLDFLKSHSLEIIQKIQACDLLDKPDDARLAELAKKYFQKPIGKHLA